MDCSSICNGWKQYMDDNGIDDKKTISQKLTVFIALPTTFFKQLS